jgi:hypothetical protein
MIFLSCFEKYCQKSGKSHTSDLFRDTAAASIISSFNAGKKGEGALGLVVSILRVGLHLGAVVKGVAYDEDI